MSTRLTYENQIQELRDLVVTMASMVDKAIARSIDALRTQNVTLAKDVRKADKEINRLRWEGEEKSITLIATQAPMAGDLRRITAGLEIFSELERMGDHAAGIAKIVIETADEPLLKSLVDIPRMAQVAREMLDESITAFMNQDEELARAVVLRDDEIDDINDHVYRELLSYMISDPTTINRATHLLWAAHNVERIGDRITNICERTVYTITGQFEELSGGRKKRQRAKLEASANGTSG